MASLRDIVLRALPAPLRQRATDLKNMFWGGYQRSHYAQFGEDIVLSGLLKGREGFYVDVGANHPRRYSNTYTFYRRGWRGLNIDPNEAGIRSFTHLRPRDTSVVLAIGKEEGSATLYRFSDPAFNTLSKEVAEKLKEKTWLDALTPVAVPILPLSRALSRYVPEGVTIDFLNIDVEGLDLAVLQGNDWNRYKPRVIAIEDHQFSADVPSESPIYSYLREKGYLLKAHVGPTLIFVHSV